MQIRTRFAPSPTGYMHIGNLRSALYAYLFAKKHEGAFLLRIEDTDQNRLIEGAVDVIYDTLKSVGILWDEGPDIGGAFGPYVQSERKHIYTPLALSLIEKGHAYRCFCTPGALEERREAAKARGEMFKYDKLCLKLTPQEIEQKLDSGLPYVIRQNIPLTGETKFNDLLFGEIEVQNATLDDNVLIKADGMPTYNFANVVDDHLMGISHVMRGMEYLSSTPKYDLLYKAFGWSIPAYIHMPPIMKDASNKLSKRTGDASFQDLIKKGYLRDAILNYIALLGWSPGSDEEFFTLTELVEAFDIKGMSKSPAIFDPQKLNYFNAAYIRKLSADAFDAHAAPYYESIGIAHMDRAVLARILQPRMEVFTQIPEIAGFLAALDEGYDAALFTNKKSKTDPAVSKAVLGMVIPALDALDAWREDAIHDALIGMAEQNGMKNGTLLWPVRIAMAGRQVTPGGAIEIAVLLGKAEAIRRLRIGQAKLNAEGFV